MRITKLFAAAEIQAWPLQAPQHAPLGQEDTPSVMPSLYFPRAYFQHFHSLTEH
jgi:hypothetical protein